MADKQTVDLEQNSPYRVAWELAKEIAKHELATHTKAPQAKADSRAYWFDLYAQSRRIVFDGWDARTAIGAAAAATAAAATAAATAPVAAAAAPSAGAPASV